MSDIDSRKYFMALVFAMLGLVLLASSFVLPWWGIHTENTNYDESTGEVNYHSEGGGGISISSGLGFYAGSSTIYNIGDAVSKLSIGVVMIMIIAIFSAIMFVASILLKWFGKLDNPKLPKIFGILAIICCLLAPIIFMGAFPGALKSDAEQDAKDSGNEYEEPDRNDMTKSFFGDYKEEDESEYSDDVTKQSWGGDLGWFFAIIAGIIMILAFVMERRGSTAPPSYDYYKKGPAQQQAPAPPPPQTTYQSPGTAYPPSPAQQPPPPPPPQDQYQYRNPPQY
jgi:amino acid transporter